MEPARTFPAIRRGQVAVFCGLEVQGQGLRQGGAGVRRERVQGDI